MTEVLACEGDPKEISKDLQSLNKELLASYKEAAEVDCNNADQNDDQFSKHQRCVTGFIDGLPTSLFELNSSQKKVTDFMTKKQPPGVLDVIGKEQISGAIDNLSKIHAIYDLGDGVDDVCRLTNTIKKTGTCGKFHDYVGQELEENIHGSKKPVVEKISNCGGERLGEATQRLKDLLSLGRDAVQKSHLTAGADHPQDRRRYMAPMTKESIQKILYDSINQLQSEFPDLAPLIYSPAFISQAQVPQSDGPVSIRRASCDQIKTELKKSLQDSVRVIASPAERDKMSENIAKSSQYVKTTAGNIWNLNMALNGMTGLKVKNASYEEIDELYKEVPGLRDYNPADIHHLKSLLKYRPELRERYMKMFQGNSKLICLLFSGIEKDNYRNEIVEKEAKFVKGVAKAIGTFGTVASYLVNPALGLVLTAAGAATSVSSSAMNISVLNNQLADAKNKQSATVNNCISQLVRIPHMRTASAESVRHQCETAVETAKNIKTLTDELSSQKLSAVKDFALYAVYLAKISPDGVSQIIKDKGVMLKMSKTLEKSMDAWKNASPGASMSQKILGFLKAGKHEELHHWTTHTKNGNMLNLYGTMKASKTALYAYYAKDSIYAVKYGSPLKAGFLYEKLADEGVKFQQTHGRAPTDEEFRAIETKLDKKISKMDESKIIKKT
jgi:hypothetical protein